MKLFKISFSFFCGISLYFVSTNLFAIDSKTYKTVETSRATLSFDQIKMAAESGDADAQYALGYMYYYGKSGATKDIIEAKKWIGKAAAQKQPQAVKALALMNRQQSKVVAYQKEPSSTTVNVEQKEFGDRTNLAVESGKDRKIDSSWGMNQKNDERLTYVKMKRQRSEKDQEPIASHVSGAYTLQLLGAYRKDQIVKMIEKHHLYDAGIYQTLYKNKNWYVLLYGQYKNKEEADLVAKKLEKQLAVKPWTKPYSSVKTYKRL